MHRNWQLLVATDFHLQNVVHHQHQENTSRRWGPLSLSSQIPYPEVNREVGWFLGHRRRWQKCGNNCTDTHLTKTEDLPFTSDLRLIRESVREENLSFLRLQITKCVQIKIQLMLANLWCKTWNLFLFFLPNHWNISSHHYFTFWA